MFAAKLSRGDDFFLRLLEGGGVPTTDLHVSNHSEEFKKARPDLDEESQR